MDCPAPELVCMEVLLPSAFWICCAGTYEYTTCSYIVNKTICSIVNYISKSDPLPNVAFMLSGKLTPVASIWTSIAALMGSKSVI